MYSPLLQQENYKLQYIQHNIQYTYILYIKQVLLQIFVYDEYCITILNSLYINKFYILMYILYIQCTYKGIYRGGHR